MKYLYIITGTLFARHVTKIFNSLNLESSIMEICVNCNKKCYFWKTCKKSKKFLCVFCYDYFQINVKAFNLFALISILIFLFKKFHFLFQIKIGCLKTIFFFTLRKYYTTAREFHFAVWVTEALPAGPGGRGRDLKRHCRHISICSSKETTQLQHVISC